MLSPTGSCFCTVWGELRLGPDTAQVRFLTTPNHTHTTAAEYVAPRK
jgi:hypothetical protein